MDDLHAQSDRRKPALKTSSIAFRRRRPPDVHGLLTLPRQVAKNC